MEGNEAQFLACVVWDSNPAFFGKHVDPNINSAQHARKLPPQAQGINQRTQTFQRLLTDFSQRDDQGRENYKLQAATGLDSRSPAQPINFHPPSRKLGCASFGFAAEVGRPTSL